MKPTNLLIFLLLSFTPAHAGPDHPNWIYTDQLKPAPETHSILRATGSDGRIITVFRQEDSQHLHINLHSAIPTDPPVMFSNARFVLADGIQGGFFEFGYQSLGMRYLLLWQDDSGKLHSRYVQMSSGDTHPPTVHDFDADANTGELTLFQNNLSNDITGELDLDIIPRKQIDHATWKNETLTVLEFAGGSTEEPVAGRVATTAGGKFYISILRKEGTYQSNEVYGAKPSESGSRFELIWDTGALHVSENGGLYQATYLHPRGEGEPPPPVDLPYLQVLPAHQLPPNPMLGPFTRTHSPNQIFQFVFTRRMQLPIGHRVYAELFGRQKPAQHGDEEDRMAIRISVDPSGDYSVQFVHNGTESRSSQAKREGMDFNWYHDGTHRLKLIPDQETGEIIAADYYDPLSQYFGFDARTGVVRVQSCESVLKF